MYRDLDFEKTLKGRIIKRITQTEDEEIIFVLKGGGTYKLFYDPD
jgi:hypothetical protein